MSFELTGPAAKLCVESDGTFVVRRGEQTVAALLRVFIETYSVRFPVISVGATLNDGRKCECAFETNWKSIRVAFEATAEADGFRLVWSIPHTAGSVGVAFSLAQGGPWYGMGERLIQGWPLSKLSVSSDPFGPADFVADGTLNISTPIWLNRAGVGLLVEADTGELAVTLNRHGNEHLTIIQRAPEAPPVVLGQPREQLPIRLALRVIVKDDIRATHQQLLNYVGRPATAPPRELFARPIWTTWARYKMPITQAQTIQFADDIVAHGYPRSVMEIDDRWQAAYGDLEFDQGKFPDPRGMVEQLHARGFKVTLWVPPFLNPECNLYRQAAQQGYLLRHWSDDRPALTRWWQGYGGLMDVGNPAALEWWLQGFRRLQEEYGVDGFKFDAGEANFVPRDGRSVKNLSRNEYADRYVDFVARNFAWTEVRCGWRSQRQGVLFREWDKWSRWGIDNGLHAVLTQALTLGLIGYPYVLPDMIGGNAYEGEVPDAELMIRWTQLTALLPSMQFSLAPWDYGPEANAICRRYARLHEQLSPVLNQCVAEVLADGTPMVRPLFWHALNDPDTYELADQFMLGDRLLVAPVLTPGQRQRVVYLPAGRWRDYWSGDEFSGPRNLDTYPAPLDLLPLFERIG
jgi:alpha-glucosidase (family GH31 glycosyl hydrolase)